MDGRGNSFCALPWPRSPQHRERCVLAPPLFLPGGAVLLALTDAYMSKRRLREEAKGLEKFLHPS